MEETTRYNFEEDGNDSILAILDHLKKQILSGNIIDFAVAYSFIEPKNGRLGVGTFVNGAFGSISKEMAQDFIDHVSTELKANLNQCFKERKDG